LHTANYLSMFYNHFTKCY